MNKLERIMNGLREKPSKKLISLEKKLKNFDDLSVRTQGNLAESLVKYLDTKHFESVLVAFDFVSDEDEILNLIRTLKENYDLFQLFKDNSETIDCIAQVRYWYGKKTSKEVANVLKKYVNHDKVNPVAERLSDLAAKKRLKPAIRYFGNKDVVEMLKDDEIADNVIAAANLAETKSFVKHLKAGVRRLGDFAIFGFQSQKDLVDYLHITTKKEVEDVCEHIKSMDPSQSTLRSTIDLYKTYGNVDMLWEFSRIVKQYQKYKKKDQIEKIANRLLENKRRLKTYPSVIPKKAVGRAADEYVFYKWLNCLRKKKKIINLFENKEGVSSVIADSLGYPEVSKFLKKYSEHKNIYKAINILDNVKKIEEDYVDCYLSLLEKYMDHDRVMDKLSPSYTLKQMDKLLEDETYEMVIKNPNAVDLIFSEDYRIVKKIKLNLDYRDIIMAISTHKLVMEIHNRRELVDKQKIENAFFLEMNRAIAQGQNYESQKKNLRTYCLEVSKAMKASAEELMLRA